MASVTPMTYPISIPSSPATIPTLSVSIPNPKSRRSSSSSSSSSSSPSSRTPLANITNSIPISHTQSSTRKKPVSAGLQDTYDHSDPFNSSSESFYCPQIVYDFCCADDLENFSIYRNQDTPLSIISVSFGSASGTNVYDMSASSEEGEDDGTGVKSRTGRVGRRATDCTRTACSSEASSDPLVDSSLGIIITPPTPPVLQQVPRRDSVPQILPFTFGNTLQDQDSHRTSMLEGDVFGFEIEVGRVKAADFDFEEWVNGKQETRQFN
ncbi:hypothetical protein VNI00_005821 [Paramarasmius palmivorus]|uniref:Uncharacterized protein n=1 Tax=Paramarasmius palmivorus TaxID=297713 RepID=A0AAW0DFW8_9AGAR